MTKLKLNLAQEAGEILTREELKKVLGGTGSGSGSGSSCNSYTKDTCSTSLECYNGNDKGHCTWVTKVNMCKCASVGIG